MSITVTGADTLAADLTRLSSDLMDPRLVRAAADEVAAHARRLAPIAVGYPRAGLLRSSIVVNPARRGPVVWVKAWARYSTFVEEGTRYTPAQPFMANAARAARVENAVDRAVDDAIRKVT